MATGTDCILWGGERLLLRPVDMRSGIQAIRDNTIAMGYRSGRVTILALDVASLPSFE